MEVLRSFFIFWLKLIIVGLFLDSFVLLAKKEYNKINKRQRDAWIISTLILLKSR